MLEINNTALVIVDVQGKLAQLMHDKENLFESIKKITKGASVLGLPVIWMEQNPAGLGKTVPEISELLTDKQPIAKTCFNCCDDENFMKVLEESKRGQVLLCGIESHICIYQTALGLLENHIEVHVLKDCVSSRTMEHKSIAIDIIKQSGAKVSCVEMALYELLKSAEHPHFKDILKVVK